MLRPVRPRALAKKRQVSLRSDATKTNFMQPEINQEVFAAFAQSYSGTADEVPRFANNVAVTIVTPGFYRHLSKNFRRKTMMARCTPEFGLNYSHASVNIRARSAQ